jgi:hypothetical protein
MVGNHDTMSGISRDLINTARTVGGIGVANPADSYQPPPDFVGPPDPRILESLAAIPMVCSLGAKSVDGTCSPNAAGTDQDMLDAFQLFDTLLVNGAGIDLDLSNGWYIYIMSALYVAVPAVTGQLVLGAKAGSAGLIKDAFQGVGNDGGNAAKTGYQHAAVNAAQTNAGSLGQAAFAKAMRKDGHANEMFGLKNQAMNAGLDRDRMANEMGAYKAKAGELGRTASGIDNVRGVGGAILPLAGEHGTGLMSQYNGVGTVASNAATSPYASTGRRGTMAPGYGKFANDTAAPTGSGGGAGGGASQSNAMKTWQVDAGVASIAAHQRANLASAQANARDQGNSWERMKLGQTSQAQNSYASAIGDQANFEAQSAAWEAKNAFASHVSSMAGIAGMNAGNLSPGSKPQDITGMSMSGAFNTYKGGGGDVKGGFFTSGMSSVADTSGAAHYQGKGFIDHVNSTAAWGSTNLGESMVMDGYSPAGLMDTGVRGKIDSITTPSVQFALPNVVSGQTGSALQTYNNISGQLTAGGFNAIGKMTGVDPNKYVGGANTTVNKVTSEPPKPKMP